MAWGLPILGWLELLVGVSLVVLVAAAWAGQEEADPGPGPAVEVRAEGSTWILTGQRRTVEVELETLRLTVRSGQVTWQTEPSTVGDLTVLAPATTALSLSGAGHRSAAPYTTGYQSGIAVELDQYSAQGMPLELKIRLFVALEGTDEELVVRLVVSGNAAVQEVRWPAPLVPDSFDATVVPFMQGMLLPATWPSRVWLYDTMSYGRGLYMPWWGHQQGPAALFLLLETPNDAGCHFAHPEGGPTRVGPRFVHSLSRFDEPRQLRLCFFDQGNYVDLAKRYRRHVQETGHFVSLREKVARNPLVGRLLGSPVVHTGILYHIQPQSSYYDREHPERNHQLVSFAARSEQLRRLRALGVEQAYVHLDGWGVRGYDNLHPDPLPPCPEAGGWEGLRQLAATCDELGYVLALHDQYRDYYHDAPSYDPRHTVLEANGERPFGNTWYGGDQSILCARLAPGFVRRNHQALARRGIAVRGAYLDVFAVVPPDECYHPEHPMTRGQCLQSRGECFAAIRALGGVVSSEEPADWAIPHLDLVHHGPYPLNPNPGSGPAMGIPVPLFSLVYHDALLVPWSLGRGEWGIPEKDLGFLHGMANAGLPYLSIEPDPAQLEQVRRLAELHCRVGLLEMTGHRFLEPTYRRQETTFADGTRVTIDLDQDTCVVEPGL